MLKSMTGYGSGQHSVHGRSWRVDIRSVNQRFLDIQVRAPRQVLQIEDRIRKTIEGAVSRGRLTVHVELRNENSDPAPPIDRAAVRSFVEQLREIKDELSIAGDVDLSVIAAARDVLGRSDEELGPDEAWEMIRPPMAAAVSDLVSMRESEGSDLARDIAERLNETERLMVEIEKQAPISSQVVKSRLEERIVRLLGGDAPVDENRLAQEVATAAERADFTEECVRLRSHLARLRECFDSDEPMGKRMNFLAQEMHREANTIGSKNEDVDISGVVILLKEEIEKIREQVQNVE